MNKSIKFAKKSEEELFKPFIFIGERIVKQISDSEPIIKDYNLKKASIEQIKSIKSLAKNDELLALINPYYDLNIYENELKIKDNGSDGKEMSIEPLEIENSNYWIIERSEKFDSNLSLALRLMDKSLTPIIAVSNIKNFSFSQLSAAVFYSDWYKFHSDEVIVDSNYCESLNKIYSSISVFKNSEFKDSIISKSLSDYQQIDKIEYESPFKIIALFSIIELLLVTNNSAQSINKQLQHKIKLINNQLTDKIDFTKYFKGSNNMKEETIIGKLYTYRSKIAHGDYVDFDKDLQVIVNHRTTCEFLELLVKKVILYSIDNCCLILNLKEC